MSQMPPGGQSLPQLTPMSMQDMLKGPQLTPAPFTRPDACTLDDPTGVKHNGTQGRVYTEYVTSYDPAEAEKQRKAMEQVQICASNPIACAIVQGSQVFDVQSAKGSIQFGPLKAGEDSDKGPSIGYKPPADGKKTEWKFKASGEVCIVHKGDKKKDGSWFTYEWKWMGVTNRAGFPDGNWCVGFDSGKAGLLPEGSITGPQ
jgi:hypothetical protein